MVTVIKVYRRSKAVKERPSAFYRSPHFIKHQPSPHYSSHRHIDRLIIVVVIYNHHHHFLDHLIIVDVDPLQLLRKLPRVSSIRLDAVLVADYLEQFVIISLISLLSTICQYLIELFEIFSIRRM